MYKFIKDNIVLMLGISLPLLLVAFFMVASALPNYLIADPKYDFFFSDGRYSYVEFQVQQQKLYMKIDPMRYQYQKSLPHLYRYIASTGKVQEITFQAPDMSKYQTLEGSTNRTGINTNIVISVDPTKLPSQGQAQDTSKIVSEINKNNNTAPFIIPVTEVAGLTINAAPLAPDGYSFSNGSFNYNGEGPLFFGVGSSYKNPGPVIGKSGKNISIPYNGSRDDYSYSLNFIGWIIP